jgi:hypothetical protein
VLSSILLLQSTMKKSIQPILLKVACFLGNWLLLEVHFQNPLRLMSNSNHHYKVSQHLRPLNMRSSWKHGNGHSRWKLEILPCMSMGTVWVPIWLYRPSVCSSVGLTGGFVLLLFRRPVISEKVVASFYNIGHPIRQIGPRETRWSHQQ